VVFRPSWSRKHRGHTQWRSQEGAGVMPPNGIQGQLLCVTKIKENTKFVAIRCVLSCLKCTKFSAGPPSRTPLGSLRRSPDPSRLGKGHSSPFPSPSTDAFGISSSVLAHPMKKSFPRRCRPWPLTVHCGVANWGNREMNGRILTPN